MREHPVPHVTLVSIKNPEGRETVAAALNSTPQLQKAPHQTLTVVGKILDFVFLFHGRTL